MRVCGLCGAQMAICLSCNHGQVYCGPACGKVARGRQHAAAQARYRNTERGKEKNRQHQRAHRQRIRNLRVSDQCSDSGATPLKPESELAVPPAPLTHKEGIQSEFECKRPLAVEVVRPKSCGLCGAILTHFLSEDEWRVWRRQRRATWLAQRHRRKSGGCSMSST